MKKKELVQMIRNLKGCECTRNDIGYNRAIDTASSLVEAYAQENGQNNE